jgi:transcriptional regulator with XRE-family HTH domain
MGITDRIFLYLENNNITQAELSRILGVKRPTVNEWQIGKSLPSPRLILKFIFHFDKVDANWLIRGKENNSESNTQIVTGNKNIQSGGNTLVSDNQTAIAIENKHLKELINEKDEQIKFLRELLKK